MDAPPVIWRFGAHQYELQRQALLMGILNVTPDSFSESGLHADPEAALAHGLALAAAGAQILDVGGESTRPGAAPVTEAEERRRVVAVIRRLRAQCGALISVDTTKASVAEAALDAGAQIVNDISGFTADPRMAAVARAHQAGCVIMHMRGTPQTMQRLTAYDDLITDIDAAFTERLQALASAGIPPEAICLDPGIGFAKTAEQNLSLIGGLDRFRHHGRPLLLGPSRKSFIGRVLADAMPERQWPPAEREWGTAAACVVGLCRGARILRVHDVPSMRQVATVAMAILNAPTAPERPV